MEENTLLNQIMQIISSHYDESSTLNTIQMQIASTLSEYSIGKKSYEIVPTSTNIIPREIQEYLVYLKVSGIAQSSLKNYQLELRLFQEYIQMPLIEVQPAHIMKYIYNCQEIEQLADVTIEHKRIVLCGFYKWLQLEHKIIDNPCARIKPIKCKTKVLEPLTNIELEQIRMSCDNLRDKCLVEVLFSSGMRVSELISVNYCDIDFSSKKMTILGKGNKERIIRFSDRAILLLKQYINERTDTNEALFVAQRKPYNRLTKSGVEYIIHKLANSAGIERISVTPHTFRRNHGLAIYNKTNDIYKASASLGHSNISTTTKYIKLSEESIQQTFNQVMN